MLVFDVSRLFTAFINKRLRNMCKVSAHAWNFVADVVFHTEKCHVSELEFCARAKNSTFGNIFMAALRRPVQHQCVRTLLMPLAAPANQHQERLPITDIWMVIAVLLWLMSFRRRADLTR